MIDILDNLTMQFFACVWPVFTFPIYTYADGYTITGFKIGVVLSVCSILIWFLHIFFKRES